MRQKLHREYGAATAMLAFRTGLSAAMCKAWIEAPIGKSAEAIRAAFLPDSDDYSVFVARSEIETYALARVRDEPGWRLTDRERISDERLEWMA